MYSFLRYIVFIIFNFFLLADPCLGKSVYKQLTTQHTLSVNPQPQKRGRGRPRKIDSSNTTINPTNNQNKENTTSSTIHTQSTPRSSVLNPLSTIQLQRSPLSDITSSKFLHYPFM